MRARRAIGVAATILSLAPAWGFYQLLTGTPWLIVVAAVVPALAWTGVVLLFDRDEPEPPRVLLAMFLWGAVVAALASQTVNDSVYAWLATSFDGEHAHVWTPAVLAPCIEEGLKAAGLGVLWLVWRDEIDGVRDGIVYGAVIGMGFAMTENVAYFLLATVQGGSHGLARAVYLRAFLQGFNHAAFTATTGAAIGWLRGPGARTRWVVALGLLAAVAQHVLWNALGAQLVTELLCGAESPGGMCRFAPTDTSLFVSVPLVVLAFLAPGGVTLLGLGVLTRTAEPRMVRSDG